VTFLRNAALKYDTDFENNADKNVLFHVVFLKVLFLFVFVLSTIGE